MQSLDVLTDCAHIFLSHLEKVWFNQHFYNNRGMEIAIGLITTLRNFEFGAGWMYNFKSFWGRN